MNDQDLRFAPGVDPCGVCVDPAENRGCPEDAGRADDVENDFFVLLPFAGNHNMAGDHDAEAVPFNGIAALIGFDLSLRLQEPEYGL